MSRSRDFIQSQQVLTKEYECQFIREQFQEIIKRKDRLLKEQELQIIELNKQIKQKNKVIYISSSKHDKFTSEKRKSAKMGNTALFKKKTSKGLSVSDQINDINQYSNIIEQYISELQDELESNQTIIQQLKNKVSSLQLKLGKKTNKILLLQEQCTKYYHQCNDMNFIKDVIQRGLTISDKQVKLDQNDTIKIKRLIDNFQNYSKHQIPSNEIDFISVKMRQHCHVLSMMAKKQQIKNDAFSKNKNKKEESRTIISELKNRQNKLARKDENASVKRIVNEKDDMEELRTKNVEIKSPQMYPKSNVTNYSDLSDDCDKFW